MSDQTLAARPIELVSAVWKRRKWLAVLAFVLPFSAVLGLAAFLPSVYRATALVVVDRQQVPEDFVRSTVTSGVETRLQLIREEILSRTRLADLVTKFNLYPELRESGSVDAVVGRMRRDTEVELLGTEGRGRDRGGDRGGTVSFRINYFANDPQTAARVANALASFYPEENSKIRERVTADTAEFLGRQLKDVKVRLEAQDRLVTEFKNRHLGQTPDHMPANLAIMDRINTQLRLNHDNQGRAGERLETLTRQLAEAEASVTGPEAAEPAAVRLMKMKQDLAELRTTFSDKYPDVILLRARIASLERQLAGGATGDATGASQPGSDQRAPATPQVLQLRRAVADAEAAIKDLKLEERRLRDEATTYERRVQLTPGFEQEFQKLSRDLATVADLDRTLSRRYEEAQLAEKLEQRQKGEQFRVLEHANPPPSSAPNRLRLLLMGFFLSCALAGGAVVLAEHLDTSFHRVDDLRASAPVPVYSVPLIVTEADLRRSRWQLGVSAVAMAAGVALVFGASYLTATGRVPGVSELAYSLMVRV
jgi:succinoglycan biosynthesis transport protein ExoP